MKNAALVREQTHTHTHKKAHAAPLCMHYSVNKNVDSDLFNWYEYSIVQSRFRFSVGHVPFFIISGWHWDHHCLKALKGYRLSKLRVYFCKIPTRVLLKKKIWICRATFLHSLIVQNCQGTCDLLNCRLSTLCIVSLPFLPILWLSGMNETAWIQPKPSHTVTQGREPALLQPFNARVALWWTGNASVTAKSSEVLCPDACLESVRGHIATNDQPVAAASPSVFHHQLNRMLSVQQHKDADIHHQQLLHRVQL